MRWVNGFVEAMRLLDHYGLRSTRINRGQSHENGVAAQAHYRVPERARRRTGAAHRLCITIRRRVKPTPGSQLARFANYRYHGCITDRDGGTLELEADHRRHAEIENAIRDLKHGVGLNHLSSWRFAAWLTVQVMAHNLARWAARLGLGEQVVTTKTLRRRFFSMAGRLTRLARRLTLHLPKGWPWEAQFRAPWHDCAPCHFRPDGAAGVNADGGLTRPPDYPTASQTCARSVPERLWLHAALTISPSAATAGRQHPLCAAAAPCTQPNLLGQALTSLSLAAHPWSDQHGYILSVDSGLGTRASGLTAVSMVACRAALPLIGEPLCRR